MKVQHFEDKIVHVLRKDIVQDATFLIRDITATVIKVIFAFVVLSHFSDVGHKTSVELAVLLGATDFFSRRRDFKTVEDIKARVSVKTADGTEVDETYSDKVRRR